MRLSLIAAAAAAVISGTAMAQDYPTGPITIVVPFAAGGPTDTVTRLIAEPMAAALGQQIVVQNVAGAGGTLAGTQVAKAPAGRLHAARPPHRHVDGALALRRPRLRPDRPTSRRSASSPTFR